MAALEAAVVQALRGGERTALAVAGELGVSPFVAARALETLSAAGRVARVPDSLPLRWRPAAPPAAAPLSVVVLVDLGNTHDCLPQLLPFAEAGVLSVRAYADCNFAGYGVRPPLTAPNCVVVQACGAERNAADVELIWDVARLSAEPAARHAFFVATKDQGFRHLKHCVEASGRHSLQFVADWPALQAALAAAA